jgi:hypothetical protein
MKMYVYLSYYLVEFFLEWEMFHRKVLEKIKTYFLFNNFSENRAVYEIMWSNTVEPGGPQMTV